jgi:hypothetical protein
MCRVKETKLSCASLVCLCQAVVVASSFFQLASLDACSQGNIKKELLQLARLLVRARLLVQPAALRPLTPPG